MEDVKLMDRGQKYKTVGGEVVIFKNSRKSSVIIMHIPRLHIENIYQPLKLCFVFVAMPSVNNVSILADYTLPNGNEVFLISEVLFVSEAIVSRLHQVNSQHIWFISTQWFDSAIIHQIKITISDA